MKVVIIGGGIAGLAAAISFRRQGFETVVLERAPVYKEVGLGFIILPNGLEALDDLGAGKYVRDHGSLLSLATLRDADGNIFKTETLSDSVAVKRSTCIHALLTRLPENFVQHGFDFSHFEFDENGNANSVVSKTGMKETGDIFIGADGSGSVIRKQIFPQKPLRDSVIRELVGIADAPALAKNMKGKMVKTHSTSTGLSIGILPCNEKQLIWYIQFDSRNQDLNSFTDDDKRNFAESLMKGWPDPINEVLAATNYSTAFLWNTRDMDLLEKFHLNNIILIGDAAHLALPFTSQGTNSALKDAIVLAELVGTKKDAELEDIFTTFHTKRKDTLNDYIEFGRTLEQHFLNPGDVQLDDMPIPLAK